MALKECILLQRRQLFSDAANNGSEKFKLLMSQQPKSWSRTMVILRTCGCQDPAEHWICFCREIREEKSNKKKSKRLLAEIARIAVIRLLSLFRFEDKIQKMNDSTKMLCTRNKKELLWQGERLKELKYICTKSGTSTCRINVTIKNKEMFRRRKNCNL